MKIIKSIVIIITTIILIIRIPINSFATIKGDIDGDNKVTSADARLCIRACVGLEDLTEEQIQIGDINNNNKIDADDCRSILRMSIGLTDEDKNKKKEFEPLLNSYRVDKDYGTYTLKLSEDQYKGIAGLVYGEMGGEGFIGCCLAAQAIKDGMVYTNCYDIYTFRNKMGYSARIHKNPNKDSIDAVNYVFKEGGYAVKHRILYMYESSLIYSSWHESQKYVVTYDHVKFFDSWS